MLLSRLTALTLCLLAVLAGCARPQAIGRPAPFAPAPAKPASPKPAPPAPLISPLLSQPEEERLRRDATVRIDNAAKIVKQISDRRLGADQQETLSTIQSFLVKARQALATQELQQAFTLADKADALAQELIRTIR